MARLFQTNKLRISAAKGDVLVRKLTIQEKLGLATSENISFEWPDCETHFTTARSIVVTAATLKSELRALAVCSIEELTIGLMFY